MKLNVWSAGLAAIMISSVVLPAAATGEGAAEASPPPAVPANSSEQIKKAQVELKRLDCLKGRIDGKLGDRTREALKKFWASAKRPPITDIAITDELITDLAEHGDNYCRPPRPFFGFGGGKNAGRLPFFAPGGKPPVPALPAGAPPQVTPPSQP